jgi:phosphatidylglycerophosphate synthase
MQRAKRVNRLIAVTPNVLSVLRLGLAGAFPLLAGGWWRAGVIVAAGLSDFADGLIARRFGVTNWIGGLLDATADKAFMLTALAVVTWEGGLEPWQTGLLLSRDAMVLGAVVYMTLRKHWAAFQQMPSRPLGKLTTAALLGVLLAAVSPSGPVALVDAVWLAGTLLSIAAAGDYLVHFLRNSEDEDRVPVE